MGLFWADPVPKPVVSIAPHPVPKDGATPPPACPMHNATPSSSQPLFPPRSTGSNPAPSSCPVKDPTQSNKYPSQPPSIDNQTQPQKPQSTLSKLNPLNYIPANLTNARLDDSPQTISLPLEREISTIPRGDVESNWEYPSPQQMYNAMLRKGYTETPADAVESMVAVHNFLNEGAWTEIVEWETIFGQGLGKGWEKCRRGEQGIAMEKAKRQYLKDRREALGIPASQAGGDEYQEAQPKLLRFQGKPGQPTPKSRILQSLAYVMPSSFNSEAPFDRHDWYVARKMPDGSTKEVRYVIDYYGGGLQATGEPVFYLDIRPALDSPSAVAERAIRWGGDVWYRASGGSAREKAEMEERMKKRAAAAAASS